MENAFCFKDIETLYKKNKINFIHQRIQKMNNECFFYFKDKNYCDCTF